MREWTPTLGALIGGTGTTFRVWAPDHDSVELVLEAGEASPGINATAGTPRPLTREDGGYWTGRFDDVPAGTLYRYRLNRDDHQRFPDPASRFQPHGVHGPSQVVDHTTFAWSDHAWRTPRADGLVFYELHVGTFSPAGTFRGAIDCLPRLVELGVSAIELMPVGDFPGARNWGYDGVAMFAPARCYGTPDDLRALVDAAHGYGLAIILDVVYNHFGPDGAYAHAFSRHYFSTTHSSPWGAGLNFDGPLNADVRRFFIENAGHWIAEYHVDGFRLDATHEIHDSGGHHFLAELTGTIRASCDRPVVFVAEDHRNLACMLQPIADGGYGLDGVWADDFHHQARVHLAGDREGYYADYTGSTIDLATTLRRGWFFTGQHSSHLGGPRGTEADAVSPHQFVICIQNHDQIGNRADGARLNHEIALDAYRALTVLLLLAPQTPLLFMGQEWAATTPFLFFTDHNDELGRAVTQGRRAEFASFTAFADPALRDAIPDPQARDTFERSRLRWDERDVPEHAGVLRLNERLLALRRASTAWTGLTRERYDVAAADQETIAVTVRGASPDDGFTVVVRMSGAGEVSIGGDGVVAISTEDEAFTPDPWPIDVHVDTRTDASQARTVLHFRRAGAVVLRPRLPA